MKIGLLPTCNALCFSWADCKLTSPSVGSPSVFLRFFFLLPDSSPLPRFFSFLFFFSCLAAAASASAASPDCSSRRSLAMKLEYSEALFRRNSNWFVCLEMEVEK